MALLELSNVTRVYTDGGLLGRRHVHAVDGVAGRANATIVTAFTDGCPGLRTVLINAGILTPPILDWFHLAMRFQHATQAASGLLADNARRVQAKAVIVEEVERLRWRIWNGKAKDAKRSIDRIRKVMHVYKRESSPSTNSTPSRRLWHALHNRRLPAGSEQLARQLCQAIPCRSSCWDVDH